VLTLSSHHSKGGNIQLACHCQSYECWQRHRCATHRYFDVTSDSMIALLAAGLESSKKQRGVVIDDRRISSTAIAHEIPWNP
jgi:hypothetical protein